MTAKYRELHDAKRDQLVALIKSQAEEKKFDENRSFWSLDALTMEITQCKTGQVISFWIREYAQTPFQAETFLKAAGVIKN